MSDVSGGELPGLGKGDVNGRVALAVIDMVRGELARLASRVDAAALQHREDLRAVHRRVDNVHSRINSLTLRLALAAVAIAGAAGAGGWWIGSQ